VGLLSINCIGFDFKKSGVKGRALYPLLSLVSHSCVSNARYTGFRFSRSFHISYLIWNT
jgi:hypothetical protein